MLYSLVCAVSVSAVSQSPVRPPTSLTAATFEQVRAYVRPTGADLLFQSIDWKTTVFDGIEAGRRQDCPIVMWMYFGDPQGQC